MVWFKRLRKIIVVVAVLGGVHALDRVVFAQEPSQPTASPREEQLRGLPRQLSGRFRVTMPQVPAFEGLRRSAKVAKQQQD